MSQISDSFTVPDSDSVKFSRGLFACSPLRWFLSWRYLFYIGLSIFTMLYIFIDSTHIFRKEHYIKNPDINSTAKKLFQVKNLMHNHSELHTLLKRCSMLGFVFARAEKRIKSEQNAVFIQGNRVIDLGDNYFVSVDDILFGYDVLFESDYLFTASSWLGVQFQSSPHDAMVLQQLIWNIKPDLIIDFGTNAGGSAVFFASIMSFYSDTGTVLTIDTKPFTENWVNQGAVRCKICTNPADNKLWKKYVQFIQGSTTDPEIITKIKQYASNFTKVFISHDASHIGDIVYQDLLNYAELVSIGSYYVVQDTKLDRMFHVKGPLTAVRKFLDYQNKTDFKYKFELDRLVEIFYYSQHAHGWLKRVK